MLDAACCDRRPTANVALHLGQMTCIPTWSARSRKGLPQLGHSGDFLGRAEALSIVLPESVHPSASKALSLGPIDYDTAPGIQ